MRRAFGRDSLCLRGFIEGIYEGCDPDPESYKRDMRDQIGRVVLDSISPYRLSCRPIGASGGEPRKFWVGT